jgi:hypothetical protein
LEETPPYIYRQTNVVAWVALKDYEWITILLAIQNTFDRGGLSHAKLFAGTQVYPTKYKGPLQA